MSRSSRPLLVHVLLAAFSLALLPAAHAADLADSPTAIRPLLLGSAAPDAPLQTLDGQATSLGKVLGGKPAVLVFYRGGWCPFCNTQLGDLRLIEEDLAGAGYQLIAISPDRPEELRLTLEKQSVGYTLVSDNEAAAMKAFGIGYVLDAETTTKYVGYNIDIDRSSGRTHHGLPVPSVFVIDAAGVIQFAYVNPDYKARVPADVILAAARAIAEGRQKVQPKR